MNHLIKEINTPNGIYTYHEKHFQNGIKKINRDVARQNLLDFKHCLESHKINFGLIYGTLLGAIREGNFIAHDEDTDIYILSEDIPEIIAVLFELREIGFEVGRFTEKLISFMKNDEYIDIYFFQKTKFGKRISEGYVIKASVLENMEQYVFLGETFNVPKNPKELLVELYGKDWHIPKENTPASNYGLYLKIRMLIKNNSRPLFNLLSRIKKKLNV